MARRRPGRAVPCAAHDAARPRRARTGRRAHRGGTQRTPQRRAAARSCGRATGSRSRSVMLDARPRLGWEPAGWKIGAASDGDAARRGHARRVARAGSTARRVLHEPGEPRRPSSSSTTATSSASSRSGSRRACPRAARAYGEDEVADAIECVLPDARDRRHRVRGLVRRERATSASCLDNGGGAALVCGEPSPTGARSTCRTRASRSASNGQRINEGYGRAAMGHPLTSLTWLANWLSSRGRGLEAGEIVSTGTCTGHCFCAPGDARLGRLRPARRRRRSLRVRRGRERGPSGHRAPGRAVYALTV